MSNEETVKPCPAYPVCLSRFDEIEDECRTHGGDIRNLKGDVDRVEDKVDRIGEALHGNGNPENGLVSKHTVMYTEFKGLKQHVENHHRIAEKVMFALCAMLGTSFLMLAAWFLSWVFKHLVGEG